MFFEIVDCFAEPATVPGFKDAVSALAFSPDRNLFAAGSFFGEIKVAALGAKESITTLTGHKAAVKRLAFSRDGKTLASAGDDCAVRLWNMATFREVTTDKLRLLSGSSHSQPWDARTDPREPGEAIQLRPLGNSSIRMIRFFRWRRMND